MARTSIFDPHNLGGLIARLVRTPDGGAEVFAWHGGKWVPADIAVRDVLTAAPVSDRMLTELGIPIEEDPSLFPLPGSVEEAQIAEERLRFEQRRAMFGPRDLGGVVTRLAHTPDGGAEIVAWSKGAWTPAPFAVGDVLCAPPASDRLMAELGIPIEDELNQ